MRFVVRNMDSIYHFTFIATCLKKKEYFKITFGNSMSKGALEFLYMLLSLSQRLPCRGDGVAEFEMYLGNENDDDDILY